MTRRSRLLDELDLVSARTKWDEVARDAAEQEKVETFILERVESGASLPGTYPPKAKYEEWRKQKGI